MTPKQHLNYIACIQQTNCLPPEDELALLDDDTDLRQVIDESMYWFMTGDLQRSVYQMKEPDEIVKNERPPMNLNERYFLFSDNEVHFSIKETWDDDRSVIEACFKFKRTYGNKGKRLVYRGWMEKKGSYDSYNRFYESDLFWAFVGILEFHGYSWPRWDNLDGTACGDMVSTKLGKYDLSLDKNCVSYGYESN